MSIKLSNINKYFEEVHALQNINIEFEKGKVYGLIGRNGAGKTTLLKIISRQLESTGGLCDSANLSIAYSMNYNAYFEGYKPKQLFNIARQTYPNYNTEYQSELISNLNLTTNKDYRKLSSGMKNLVSLIIALSSDADYLLLDEPYVGLDPINRDIIYRFLVNHYFDEDHTVIISSHVITEIEGYFENAIIIDNGKIIINEEIEDIKKKSKIITTNKKNYESISKKVHTLSVDTIAERADIYIYDDINKITEDIKDATISQMNLQTLMIKMLGSKEKR